MIQKWVTKPNNRSVTLKSVSRPTYYTMESGPGYRAKARIQWKTGVCGKQNKICLPPSNTEDCSVKPVTLWTLPLFSDNSYKKMIVSSFLSTVQLSDSG